MLEINWLSEITIIMMLIAAWSFYLRGWKICHSRWPQLFSRLRLNLFFIAICITASVILFPAYLLSRDYLSVRAIQKVLVCMVLPLLFWLSIPFHAMSYGVSRSFRRWVVQNLIRQSRIKDTLRAATQPGVVWLIYTITFLLWHEPSVASWTMQRTWANKLMLVGLLLAALLFWWHVLRMGLRLHRELPIWGIFIYLVGVEILNMLAGVTIAFTRAPIYSYYIQRHALVGPTLRLTAIEDQMLSGGFTWIIGSIVYISTIVLVLNRYFKAEKGAPPILSFTESATERTIAPGLEHRIYKNRWLALKEGEKK